MTRTVYFAICAILFVVVMTGWWFVARWLVHDIGWWVALPGIAFWLVVSWLIDRHEAKKRLTKLT